MIVRREQAGDAPAIARLIERAFGQADEAHLVDRLRSDGDAIVSLVATDDGGIMGHIMFSRMRAPCRALGLAPLAVAPERQRRGIGAALVREGLAIARDGGWTAVFVLGDPAYYERFGFRADLARSFASPYSGQHLMALALDGPMPAASGRVDYPPAFDALE